MCYSEIIKKSFVFIQDENDPEFIKHILARAELAKNPKHLLSLKEFKQRLAAYREKQVDAQV